MRENRAKKDMKAEKNQTNKGPGLREGEEKEEEGRGMG